MKTRLLTLSLSALLIVLALAACGGGGETTESPLLRMLRFVPDTPGYREYLTYGDAEAWHTSWDIPRIDSLEELDSLDRESRAYWLFILWQQSTPPDSLGFQSMFADDLRGAYGFDLFNLDRYTLAGMPPDYVTIVEFSFDEAQIADALTASGYEVETLEEGGKLYSILDDYELDFEAPTMAGKLGNLNRIALLDGHMVVAKATAIVTSALLAHNGERSSLADNPDYVAAAKALEDPALKDTGELIGAIMMEGSQFYALDALIGPQLDAEQLETIREKYTGQGPRLPAYKLVAFATRHTEGASYLILAVVFPKGADASAAADILADRLRNYESWVAEMRLDERWTFDQATGTEAEGLPVALVVMRADDPPPTPEDASMVNTAVFSWMRMIVSRDTLFLTIE